MTSIFLDIKSTHEQASKAFALDWLFIDLRYIYDEEWKEEERFAISYGLYSTAYRQDPFAQTPKQSGKFVFKLHQIGVTDNRVRITDLCIDTYPADDNMSQEAVHERADKLLADLSDDYYTWMGCPPFGSKKEKPELKRRIIECLEFIYE